MDSHTTTTSRRNGNKKKRSQPSTMNREEERSKSRKRQRGSSGSTATFPLTEDAIELLAKGVALLPCNINNDRKKVDHDDHSNKKDNYSEGDQESPETSLEYLTVKLRIDEAATPKVTAKSQTRCAQDNGDGSEDVVPFLFGTVGDGRQSIRVLILDPPGSLSQRLAKEKDRNKKYDWIVNVRGYASTEAVWNVKFKLCPIICLTSVSVLSTIKRKKSMLGEPFSYNKLISARAHTGSIGSFLKDRAPFLTDQELAGSSKVPMDQFLTLISQASKSSASPTTNNTKPCVFLQESESADKNTVRELFPETPCSNRKKVQDFLSFAMAMNTLIKSSSSSPSSSTSSLENANNGNMFSPTKLPTEHAAELYTKTLQEFTASQMDRQNASLGTNARRESAERAILVVQRHNDALELAVKETKPLTIELLCSWHRELLKDIHPEAGKIRTRTVRCGQTVFCPTSRIRSELEMFCTGLQSLATRLDMNNAIHAALYAAVAMYGIVDIHPFLDGNGRLSRIVANYALMHLPFSINLFATPAQRSEYVLALEQTRHVLSMSSRGNVSKDEMLLIIKYTGVFDSLVDLMMDRVAKAALECNKVWEEKSGLAAEAAEARAARRVRERAAQGTCIICFDDNPNIATLCCGKAIHLNCIAEWLSGKNTCPNCRSEMPPINGRVVRAVRRTDEEGETEAENVSEALEVARQNIQDIRETRELLARIYDQVAHQGGLEEMTSSDSSFFSSSSTEGEDTTTTTTSEEEGNEEELIVSQSIVNATRWTGQAENNHADNSEDTTTTTSDSESSEHGSDETYPTNDHEADGEGEATTTTRHDVQESGTDDNNPTTNVVSRQRLSFCLGDRCRNRAAVDCTNDLCGRCCILAGEYHCPRHNS